MKVLIIGAGAVGIGIGASLKDSGFEVDFYAKGKTKEAIDRYGIGRTGMFKSIVVPAGQVGTYDDYEQLPEDAYDYIIISTKTVANYEVAVNLDENSICMKEECKIVFMQNGMGYEAPFMDYFGQHEVYHSRIITGFMKEVPNVSVVTAHQDDVLIGSIYGYPNDPVKPLIEAINKSGIPARTEDELSKALWAKLIYNTTLNPLGAILGMSYGELADSDYAHSIMDILIEETFEIMNRAGGKTYWDNAEDYRTVLFDEMIPVTYEHRSSTLQDIERKQKTEIDTLTGALLSVASNCNMAAPMHSMIYSLVKALEEKF